MRAIDWSKDNVMEFNPLRSIVRPSWMFEEPEKAAWPPLFTANGHWVRRASNKPSETC